MVIEYVAGVKTAWDLAKAIKVSADAIDDAQMKLQIAELIAALADARAEATESSELIVSLQQQLKSKALMKFNGNVYYKVAEGEEQEGPWCPTCYDARDLEIRLQTNRTQAALVNWMCRECGGFFL